MIFRSDLQFEIRNLGKLEGRLLQISSCEKTPEIDLFFVLPSVFELPTRFDGIIVKEALATEFESLRQRINPEFLRFGDRLFVLETSQRIFFILCASMFIEET